MEPLAQQPTTDQPANIPAQVPISIPTIQPVATATTTQYVENKKRIPKWLIIGSIVFLGLVIFFVGIFLAVAGATKAPQIVSDQFVDHVQAGDVNAAYSLTSKAFRDATSTTQLTSVINQVKPNLQGDEKVTNRNIQKNSGSPATAVFVYKVSTPKGARYIKTVLQKDKDDWQIVNFRSKETPLEPTTE